MGYIDVRIVSDIEDLGRVIMVQVGEQTKNVFKQFESAVEITNKLDEYIQDNNIQGIKANVSELMAEEILKRAKYYCPVDTGKLVNSGRIERKGDGTCDIVFGNEDCTYAWYVHENMSARHATPTRAKFLTRAVQEVEAMWNAL